LFKKEKIEFTFEIMKKYETSTQLVESSKDDEKNHQSNDYWHF
jgi:hypothetical protein